MRAVMSGASVKCRPCKSASNNRGGSLDGMNRSHLIGDRTDTADARGDVRRFSEMPSMQERFKQSRRLENLELHIFHFAGLDLDQQRAFAFDPRHVVDLDGAAVFSVCAHTRPFPCVAWRLGQLHALNDRNARNTSSGSRPLASKW